MKNNLSILTLVLSCFLTFQLSAQDKTVLVAPDIVWAGIDFSEAKMVGADGFSNPNDVKDRFFDSWNDLVLNEADKYDVKKFYLKNKQINDLSVVNKRNDQPDVSELVVDEPNKFEEGKLQQIVSNYDLEEVSDGLGLVYVVESFNKRAEQATINVVFFDIASKNVVWSKEYKTKPGGFGFRNYWARAILNTMEESGKDFKKAIKDIKKG